MDRMDIDVPSHRIFKVAAGGSKIPIFMGKASEFQAWVRSSEEKG